MVITLNDTLSILVRVCIWVLGFYKLEALGALLGSLEFFSLNLWLNFCALVFVCLMKIIIDLLAMDRRMFNNFSLESGSGLFYMSSLLI